MNEHTLEEDLLSAYQELNEHVAGKSFMADEGEGTMRIEFSISQNLLDYMLTIPGKFSRYAANPDNKSNLDTPLNMYFDHQCCKDGQATLTLYIGNKEILDSLQEFLAERIKDSPKNHAHSFTIIEGGLNGRDTPPSKKGSAR